MNKIKSKIIKFLKSDLFERIYKTFFQSFVGVFLTVQFTDLGNGGWQNLMISGFTAGVCAVWNILKVVIDKNLTR